MYVCMNKKQLWIIIIWYLMAIVKALLILGLNSRVSIMGKFHLHFSPLLWRVHNVNMHLYSSYIKKEITMKLKTIYTSLKEWLSYLQILWTDCVTYVYENNLKEITLLLGNPFATVSMTKCNSIRGVRLDF